MSLDWASFGQVVVVSAVVAVGVMILFAVGVSLLTAPAPEAARVTDLVTGATDPAPEDARTGAPGAPGPGRLRLVGAALCFGVCAAVVLYGLSLIVR